MAKKIFTLIFIILILLTTAVPAQGKQISELKSGQETADCVPNSGWRWVSGPASAEEAQRITKALEADGLTSAVTALSYGEVDNCGTYSNYGYDYEIDIKMDHLQSSPDNDLSYSKVKETLKKNQKSNYGNILVKFPDKTSIKTNGYELLDAKIKEKYTNQTINADTTPLLAGSFYRNVYVIILNPLLKNGQTLIETMNWNNPDTITAQTINFFETVSNHQLQYKVVDTTVYNTGWLELTDGYRYTEEEFLSILRREAPEHYPNSVNYNKLVNMPDFDICGRANRGEIDEVWVYGSPFMGFYESSLVGPGSYWYNSPPVPGPWTCEKMIPIMAPSYERQISEAIENFGHRSESTLDQTYGYRTDNNSWGKFSLVKALSPNSSYSGCGNVHFPANGVRDYDWQNVGFVDSNCTDFLQYPDLPVPPILQRVNCSVWNCNGLEYFNYWFSHFPHNPGCGPDHVSNQWWNYLSTPGLANVPIDACAYNARLYLNKKIGRPGSAFTVRGTGFTPNSLGTVEVNSTPLAEKIPIDGFGNFLFILLTDDQVAPGTYQIKVTSSNNAMIDLTIDLGAELLPIEGTAQTILLPSGANFSDGFEAGNLSAWSSSVIDGGDLSASTASALIGNYGLQAVINDNNPIYVTDATPSAESQYGASFYFDPNSIKMTSGNSFYIFSGISGSSTGIMRIEFGFNKGKYQLAVSVLTDASTWKTGSWVSISDAPHILELDWIASTAARRNNGSLTFSIDGVQRTVLSRIDNDTRRIDSIQLGAVGGIDVGTRGTCYFDSFASKP